ncbi:hypothetical protein FWK35_00029485 [Aphis craccivora]|uniref:Uncharacterized protein n=1 Tax=Aphis craccivora TaxID=307492 RepID=A0A6G0Y1R5_APHCR|nr:hypothetical protein FWK35_00029485 [Aphis craccivora]
MLQFQTLGVVSDVKRSKVNIFQQFSKKSRKTKKNDRKTGIFTQNKFLTKSIFLYGCNSKTNHCKFLKFSPNNYVSVIYIQLNFHKILTFFDSNFYEICRKRENLQRNDNDLSQTILNIDT